MSTSINKIGVIGQTAIHKYSMSLYFFSDGQDGHVSVNGNRYRSMIKYYFWSQLDMDLEDMWFQQDGATSHTANVYSIFSVINYKILNLMIEIY